MGSSVRSNLFADGMGGSSTTNNGPTARPAACDWARPGGQAVSKHFPFSREAGGPASLPLDCFKVAAPAMDSPNEDGFPSILFCWSVSAASSAPGLAASLCRRRPDGGEGAGFSLLTTYLEECSLQECSLVRRSAGRMEGFSGDVRIVLADV